MSATAAAAPMFPSCAVRPVSRWVFAFKTITGACILLSRAFSARETPQKNGEQGVGARTPRGLRGTRPADGSRAHGSRAHQIASSNGYGSGGHQKEVDWFAQPTLER